MEVLLDVCKDNTQTFRDFFELKAKEVGLSKLRRYDLYLPVEKGPELSYSYQDAQRMVLDSWKEFSPELAEHVKDMFTGNRIDYGVRRERRTAPSTTALFRRYCPTYSSRSTARYRTSSPWLTNQGMRCITSLQGGIRC